MPKLLIAFAAFLLVTVVVFNVLLRAFSPAFNFAILALLFFATVKLTLALILPNCDLMFFITGLRLEGPLRLSCAVKLKALAIEVYILNPYTKRSHCVGSLI